MAEARTASLANSAGGNARSPVPGLWLAAGAVAVSLVILIGIQPYTIGYGARPGTIADSLWTFWNAFEGDWQHCILVPPIVGWLVWRDRKYLATLPVKGSAVGLVPVLFGFLLYWLGFKADVIYLGYAGIQCFLFGAVLWVLGWAFLKALLFPLSFVAFVWPLLFMDNMLAFPLRIVMSDIAYLFLNLVGLDAVRVGTAIVSAPNPALGLEQGARFAVDIANPCSGIRSLFALMMLTCLYGHLTMRTPLQKIVLFALSLPLAVIGNFVRILLLTFGTLWFGADFAIGTLAKPSAYHMMAGFAVFAAALALMVAVGKPLAMLPAPVANLLGAGRTARKQPPPRR